MAFGCDGRLGADIGAPHDATFRLERNVWNGAVEPRLVLRHAQALCAGSGSRSSAEPGDYLAGVLAELETLPSDASALRRSADRADRARPARPKPAGGV